jgi:hypothetical protein
LPDNKLHRTIFIRKLLDGVAALMFILKGMTGNVKAVWKAHIDYYKSIKTLKEKRKLVRDLTIEQYGSQLMNKSIVFMFYIKGRKTFSSLNIQN